MSPRTVVRAAAAVALAACASPTRPRFEPAGEPLVSVVAGPDHSCGLASDGRAYCWGDNSSGQLGNGSVEYVRGAVPVVGGLRFASLAVAYTRSCGVTRDARAFCWGSNPTSGLVRGLKALEESRRGAPVAVVPELALTAIGVGRDFACGLTAAAALHCWGARGDAALGNGFTTLAVGAEHACALDGAGGAWCWGSGLNGELGSGATLRAEAPVAVAGALSFTTISVGADFTCATTPPGEAYCWGRNHLGQLGAPSAERCGGYPCATRPLRVPVPVPVRSVSAGDARSCALADGGAVYCWGGGPMAIVNRWTSDTAAPRLVPLGTPFRSLSVGGHRACGITAAGEAVCWSASLGLPPDPAGREGSRMITRWFLAWTLGGAALGVVVGLLVGYLRSGTWAVAGGVQGALLGAATGFAAGFLVGFLNVMRSLG